MLTFDVSKQKIGLVLTGGGAKGAYQIGCWKALRSAGVTRFAAIAGTSVGAMNGALIAADKLDAAEAAWQELRWSRIVGINPFKIALLPFWLLAAAFSEFSLARLLEISGLLAVPQRISLGGLLQSKSGPRPSWALWGFDILGLLGIVGSITRRVFLGWFFTTSGPLAQLLDRLLQPNDIEAIQHTNVPVFATLSRYQVNRGWIPEYVRLDKLSQKAVVETLLQSAGFPGVFPVRPDQEDHTVDGGWTDNVPAAPLLFHPEVRVDLIFVIKVNKSFWQPGRFRRLFQRLRGVLRKASDARTNTEENDSVQWATARWMEHAESRGREPGARPRSDSEVHSPRSCTAFPRIVSVMPSEPPGNFCTGTLWFSRNKTRRLIELGERDMNAALDNLKRNGDGG